MVNQNKSHQLPPGVLRPVLITNDRFVDHKKEMRDRTLFEEWQRYYCYKHSRSGRHPGTNSKDGKRDTRTIEWNHWGGVSTSKVWHFPVKGWGFHERFVVRIPSKDKSPN